MSHPNLSLLPGALCFALLATGCHRQNTPPVSALPAVGVRVVTVESRPHVAVEEVAGTVRPRLRAGVSAKLSAAILELPVLPGDRVAEGDLLATLDGRELSARLDGARASAEQAAADAGRFRKLWESRSVTQKELDEAVSRERQTRATVTEMETLLSYTRLRAPFAGVITRKLADVGDLARPGTPILEMEDPERLQLDADIPEALLDRIQPGQKLSAHLTTADVRLEGSVAEIAPSADPLSRTFLVKIDLPASKGVRAGQFARLEVPIAETQILEIPAAALIRRGQMELVFANGNGHAVMRLVKTGKTRDGRVEILSGLDPGESVVMENAHRLRDGQPLTIQP